MLFQEDLKPVDFPQISIGFDAKRAFYNRSGLGNYSRNLLSSLITNYPDNKYYLFSPVSKKRISFGESNSFHIVEPQNASMRIFGSLWRSRFIVNDIKKSGIDLYHGLSHELPVGIEKSGTKSIVTVHDLIFLRHPELYSFIDGKIYLRKVVHACRVSDRIVAISEQTKRDLIDFLDIKPEKITVIYQDCDPRFRRDDSGISFSDIRKKYCIPDNYLLYVGTIEERKNLLGIVRALYTSGINIPLVAIGRKREPYFKKVTSFIKEKSIKNVFFPENVTNEELPALYRNAECFIYPSFFEGFGIPVVEALVSGVPVITSTGSCFEEAGGPQSIYTDPSDYENLGESIKRVTEDKQLQNRMILAGKDYAEKFRGERISEEYMKLYHSILV